MTLGVGVIGTGFVAKMHLAALRKLPGVRLAGAADLDIGRARSAVAGVPDARWTTSVAELLGWPEVDGCIVCTPNDTHVEIGLAVATRANICSWKSRWRSHWQAPNASSSLAAAICWR